MKNVTRFAIFMAIFCFYSCASTSVKRVHNPNKLPEASLVTLQINEYSTVVSFDGEEVDWKPRYDFWGTGALPHEVKIPAGEHTFLVMYHHSYYVSVGGDMYRRETLETRKPIEIRCVLEKGKFYVLQPEIKAVDFATIIEYHIYRFDNGEQREDVTIGKE